MDYSQGTPAAPATDKPANPRWSTERAIEQSGLTRAAKSYMLVLLRKTDKDTGQIPRQFAPSLAGITALAGYRDEPTMREARRLLEREGWISVTEIGTGRGRKLVHEIHHRKPVEDKGEGEPPLSAVKERVSHPFSPVKGG